MTKEEYLVLYERWLRNEISDFDLQRLQSYQDEFQLSEVSWNSEALGAEDQTRKAILDKVKLTLRKKQKRSVWLMRSVSVAAMLILSIGVVNYIRQDTRVMQAREVVSTTAKESKFYQPGSSRAVLTLADGSVIDLENARKGQLALQGETSIIKSATGELIYDQPQLSRSEAKASLNTIATPSGGRFQVVLSDGTRAWLNAGSSLRFPTAFTGNSREVMVTGEVYFEVATDKDQPFLVSVANTNEDDLLKIQVIGTHFNVSAYPELHQVKTTLLEGSVKILYKGEEKMLRPGYAATIGASGTQIQVAKADLEKAVSWRSGYFVFRDENIQVIMEEVARWYDVDVVYKGDMSDKDFAGTVSRFENVSQVLKVMELTGIVHFKLEGRTVTVTP